MNLRFSFVSLPAICCILSSASLAQQNSNYSYKITKTDDSNKGAVVSAHSLASIAGLKMLNLGGNAFDAAIATQLALAVVYPGAGNLGGGGFLVAHLQNGQNIALDYREKAPAAARRDMFLDSAGNPQMEKSQYGHLAAGVPGTVAGLFATLKYAKLPMRTIIAPAIDLAENGFVITASQANSFNVTRGEFLKYNHHRPAFVRNIPWKAGDTLFQPQLAKTLKRIAAEGEKGFYEGETANLIIAEMKKGNGIISLEDLKGYRTANRSITNFTYRGYQVLTMPLPSSGGIILQQMLKMTEPYPLAKMKFQTAESVQLMIEIERRAYADRAAFLGDPDFVQVPVGGLTDPAYLRKRMSGYRKFIAGSSDVTREGLPAESKETTHISIVDNAGNAVAVTTTLNGGYGSKTVVEGAGFFLNNEMDDFSVKPGVPNMYGAIGNQNNAIAPGKRMLSSMTPTILLKNGKPFLVVGTPGGTTIPTSVYQTIINIIDFKMRPLEAVNKPKFHHQWLPDVVATEKDFNIKTKAQLLAMGYKFDAPGQIGRVELIKIDFKNASLTMTAVGDKRGDDDAETQK